jgi:hypothetical protein
MVDGKLSNDLSRFREGLRQQFAEWVMLAHGFKPKSAEVKEKFRTF